MKSMTPERWQRVEDIFDLVVDAPAHERERILTEACAGDDALHRDVSTLLDANDRSQELFETPPLLVAREALEVGELLDRDHVSPGDLIGPWRVVRLLGRGGMGAVYLAERADGAFDKSVALKIVKRGMDTDEIVQRFHHERRILARLEHRNIAGLLDGGRTPDGLPFFVMELAAGKPIDRWCDEHTLTLRERLHLFQTVCDAVQYAHGNLVVHRDLKPGNIFVSEGAVKLLDFGIAKLVGPAADAPPHVTQAYAARLTPQYASPEQIRGLPTSTAADVYSLGVILYELLCGRSPYRLEGKTLLEMEQTVCTEEPPRPSLAVTRGKDGPPIDELARRRGLHGPESLVHALYGDIDAICLKALSKEASQRYVSAAALAEDIQRHLEGRVVRAHPPLRGYRFRKFVARNRLAVALATTTALVLIGATIGMLILFSQARRASIESDEQADRARAALQLLLGTLRSFDPGGTGQRELAAQEIVERGLENLAGLGTQPLLRATVLNTMGELSYNLGLPAVADSLFHEALTSVDSIEGNPDRPLAMLGLGRIHQRVQACDSAMYWIRRAVELYGRMETPPIDREAESLSELGFTTYICSNRDSVQLRRAEEIYTAILARSGEIPETIIADVHERLADVETVTGRVDEAISNYREAIQRRTQVLGPDHPANARGTWGPIVQLVRLGRYDEAVEMGEQGLDILLRRLGPEHRDVAWAYYFLGWPLLHRGDFDAAAANFRESAIISEEQNGRGYVYTGRAWSLYGQAKFQGGDVVEGERALRLSLDLFDLPDTAAREAADIAETRLWLGRALVARGAHGEALPHLRAAWSTLAATSGRAASAAASARELADLYARMGRPDSAEAFRARAVSAGT